MENGHLNRLTLGYFNLVYCPPFLLLLPEIAQDTHSLKDVHHLLHPLSIFILFYPSISILYPTLVMFPYSFLSHSSTLL